MARPRSKDFAGASPGGKEPRRSRFSRWLGIAAILLAVAAAAGWFARVWIVNFLLARFSPEWRVTVERVEPLGGGLSLSGVSVYRPGEAEPFFTAAGAVSTSGIGELRAGNLGDLTLETPVFRWQERSDPSQAEEPPAAEKSAGSSPDADPPLVVWRSLAIRGGRLSIRVSSGGAVEKGPGSLFLESELDSTGGGGAVYRNGAVRTEARSLIFRNANLELLPEASATRLIRLTAPEITARAALDHRTRMLEIEKALVSNPVLSFEGRVPEAGPPGPESAEKEPWLRGVTVREWLATGMKLKAEWPFFQGAPPASISTGLNFEGRDLRWTAREGLTAGAFKLAAVNLEAAEIFTAASVDAEVVLSPDRLRVPRLSLKEGAFPSLRALLRRAGMPEERVSALPRVRWHADAELKDWTFAAGKAGSPAPQFLTLREAEAELPDGSALRFGSLRLEAVPDEALAARRLRLVELEQPSLSWTGAAPDWGAFRPDEARETRDEDAPERGNGFPEEPPLWQNWIADKLTVNNGRLRAVLPRADGAVFSAGFSIATENPDTPGLSYRVDVVNPRLDHPAAKERAPYQADSLEVAVSPEALWGRREIASAALTGSRLEIGAAFFQMLESKAETETPEERADDPAKDPAPDEEEAEAPWRLGRLTVRDTLVWLDDVGDGRRLEIPVAPQVFNDLPLTAAALADFDRVYQVEVPNITLYSPWVEGQKVAVLDGNYVRFSPSGILRRELERVELMLPSLYAGQPLFDYIDAARKRFQTLAAGPPVEPKTPEGAQSPVPPPVDASTPPPETPEDDPGRGAGEKENSGWHIPFYANSGKVIVAPKGNPWPDIPVFPFRNARSKDGKPVPFLLSGDEFHGELAVAPGWYEFPQYKLRIRLSDKGRIVFNSPVKNRDNNLVEVFEDNTVIYRQLPIDKVWLAITYDRGGIYARFGGATCGGYINGQMNLYLDELYTWDGFVSFSKINMKPLTDKLSPDYVRMDGVIDDLTLRAWGDVSRLYQTTGSLKVSRPGRLEILAIDALQGKLQEMDAGISRRLGEIGVDTLKDFDFTECTGNLRFHGSEGKADLRLSGPGGSRNFNFNLRDYRVRLPEARTRF